MMELRALPALQDNYIWLLVTPDDHCLIIDPGEADVLTAYLLHHHLTPDAVLVTHHHADHTAGVATLKHRYPSLTVYGPAEARACGVTQIVRGQDTLSAGAFTVTVYSTPGHTAGHVCYYVAPWLFCGDTLFSAGCGRLFEGTAQQMYHSLQLLARLPADTQICAGHEYTLANLRFAHSVLPDDDAINTALRHVEQLRQQNKPTLPSTLAKEKAINLFLQVETLREHPRFAEQFNGLAPWEIFAVLRQMKDKF